jgi:hypothetical protein
MIEGQHKLGGMPADALGSDLRPLIGSDAILTDEAARVLAGTDFITQRGIPPKTRVPEQLPAYPP